MPRAERRTVGGGERDFSAVGHLELSVSMSGWSLGDVVGRDLRARAWMVGWDSRVVRVFRMLDPCEGIVSVGMLEIG